MVRIWVTFGSNNKGFGCLSTVLREVCSQPVIDLVDVILESFEVMTAVDRFIQDYVKSI